MSLSVHTLLQSLERLQRARDLLSHEFPDLLGGVDAHALPLLEEFFSHPSFEAGHAQTALLDLSISMAEAVFTNTAPEPWLRLRDLAKPAMHTTRRMPHYQFHLSESAFAGLLDANYPYHSLTDIDQQAQYWITMGPLYGAKGWKSQYPRKNPVTSYWQKRGFILPLEGLHPEGLDLYVKAIEQFKPSMAHVRRNNTALNWRVYIAMCLAGHGEHFNVKDTSYVNLLSEKDKEFLVPTATMSAHQTLERAARIDAGPSIKDVLSLPKEPMIPIPTLFPEVA